MLIPRAVFQRWWRRGLAGGACNLALLAPLRVVRRAKRSRKQRAGKVLLFFAIAIPAILGVIGLIFDAGLMMAGKSTLAHAVDAGATAGAMDLLLGKAAGTATQTSILMIREGNDAADVNVTVNIPPTEGSYAGRPGFLEVLAERPFNTRFIHVLGADPQQSLAARSVAGFKASTAGAAIVVLDPQPPSLSINTTVPGLFFPALIAGFEVLGAGTVRVDAAVLVNTTWGGLDEEGNPAGDGPGPPYGVACTPLVQLTNLRARDIRVAGGVDNPDNYGNVDDNEPSPLRANRLPVPDPYEALPVPSIAADPTNVNATLRGGVAIAQLPLLSPPTVLQPGVYEWIQVTAGQVTFAPGIYIIRNMNPTTGVALNLAGGTVSANGVMFYLTNSPTYDATAGAPDDVDGEVPPATSPTSALQPSAVINLALAGSLSGLADSGSPFNRLLIYQRRRDFRPVVIAHQNLLAGGSIEGTLYAKWGHVAFVGNSTYDLRIVAGSVRLTALTAMTIAPTNLLPPAQDVFLVE